MKIGLIDVDGHNFPNLCLMKISAWHKKRGDSVEWYDPLASGMLDKVYMSKVFSFTPDYPYNITAKEIIKGGSGYRIYRKDGIEYYDSYHDEDLPYEIEHIYPDYSIYYGKIKGIEDTAYGFLSRGCPRGCHFCHVGCKEGRKAYKVADLNEFWDGQKNICLCDPNLTAVPECLDLFDQLIESNAKVDFTQGLDIRMMTEAKAEKLSQIRTPYIHFAWDRYQDKEMILPKFKQFKEIFGGDHHNLIVYVLSNFDTTIEQDLERCYTLRDMDYSPYLMIYNKDELPKNHTLRQVQRYVNSRFIFWSDTCKSFEDYKRVESPPQLDGQISLF